jgi:hypothetical protein
LDIKLITAEYEGFYRESVGYASYRRDVSCYTNFRRVFGDRGRRFDAAVPLLFADYADLESFVSGHTFGSMPGLWSDPRSDDPPEFLPQDAVAAAGGLRELHIVRCLHAPGFLQFLVATASQRIPDAFFASDSPGARKYLMKGVMLQQAYARFGLPAPTDIARLTLPRRGPRNNCGLWCVWTWKNTTPKLALLTNPVIGEIDWSPLEGLTLDFYRRYCGYTARLIPEEFRETLLAGLRATGVDPCTDRDYEELERVRQFVLAIHPPGTITDEE